MREYLKTSPTLLRIAVAALIHSACTADRPASEPSADTAAAADSVATFDSATTASAGPADGFADEEAPAATDSSGVWTARDTRVSFPVTSAATLRAVRTATHPGYDRIVLDFGDSPLPTYRIAYIDHPVRQCGSGAEVPLPGDAWLSIAVEPAHAHTEEGRPTIDDRDRVTDYPNLLELRITCDFEAIVAWVAAVASPQPYRVLTLTAPTRLVVDIRHRSSSGPS